MSVKLADIDTTEIPSLDELRAKFESIFNDLDENYLVSLVLKMRMVASGEIKYMSNETAMLAAQCVCVLIKHFGVMESRND